MKQKTYRIDLKYFEDIKYNEALQELIKRCRKILINKAIEEVYRKLSRMSKEEFYKKLDEHKNGYYAKIMRGSGA